jgi:hypothetical protein
MTTKTKKPAARAAKPTTKPAPIPKAKAAPKGAAAPLLGEHPVPAAKTEPAAKPEPKATPAPTEGKATKKAASKERAATIPNEAKLTALFKADANPARAGTTAWKVRDLYLKSKTVGEWREAVRERDLDPGYLQNDIRRGLIRVG